MGKTAEFDFTREKTGKDLRMISKGLIHRCNNFLALVVARGETAVAVNTAEEMEKALRAILQEAVRMEEYLHQSRRNVDG